MTEESDVDILENYILGNLSKEEKAVVEKRLLEEQELNALFRDLKVLVTAIRHESRKDLANELKQVESAIHSTPKTRNLWPVSIGIAASVALLISLVFYFKSQSGPNDKLFAENFTPYTNIYDPASRGPEHEQALAFRYYDEGNYTAAIREFGRLAIKDDNTRFYLANALMANDQSAEAVGQLKLCLQREVLPDQSRWYLALCYLKLSDDKNAIYYLETISKSESNYAGAAASILRELKKK
jgi:hypothetical protein